MQFTLYGLENINEHNQNIRFDRLVFGQRIHDDEARIKKNEIGNACAKAHSRRQNVVQRKQEKQAHIYPEEYGALVRFVFRQSADFHGDFP